MSFDPTRPTTPPPFAPVPPEPFTPALPEGSPASAWAAPTGATGGTGAAAAGPTTQPVPSPQPVISGPVVAGTTAAVPPAASTRRRAGGGWLNVVLAIAAAVAIGGVAFAVGRSTAPASAATTTGRVFNGSGQFPQGSFVTGANGGNGFVRGGLGLGSGLTIKGTVEAVDADSITIKTESGQTIELSTGSSTTYHSQVPATAADVKTGSTVQVQLDGGGAIIGRPGASAAPSGPVGTAGSITVVP